MLRLTKLCVLQWRLLIVLETQQPRVALEVGGNVDGGVANSKVQWDSRQENSSISVVPVLVDRWWTYVEVVLVVESRCSRFASGGLEPLEQGSSVAFVD